MRIESLDPKMKRLLLCIPQKNEAVEIDEVDGKVVLVYPKNFTRFEKFLHRHIGGPESIRRPLDEKGTFIWKMCDGKHNVHEICQASYDEFHEDIEPVLRRVWGFLETLLKLNLISMEMAIPKEDTEDDENEKEKGEEKEG